jgi:hypothetical protein
MTIQNKEYLDSELLGSLIFSIVQNSKYYKTRRFGNWMFPSSDEGREIPTPLGPLEKANLNRWTLCFLVFGTPDDGQNPETQ